MPTLIFLLSFGIPTWASGNVIISPVDRSFVRWEQVKVIGLTKNPSAKSVVCQVNGGEVVGSSVVPVVRGAFAASVRLKKGLNEISVTDQHGQNPQKVSVFLVTDDAKPQEGFNPFFTHFPLDREDQCQDCHNLKGEAPAYNKMIPSATCTSGQCHSNMGKGKFVHGPVGSATCIACHNPHGTPHKYLVTRPGGQGCSICHDTHRKEFKDKVVHSPVSEGGCIDCHDPHESTLKFQLKGSSQQDLCFNCHDSNLVKESFLHTPLKGGNCIACHNAHASPNGKLLASPREEICFSCHEDAKKGMTKKSVHEPVREDCQKCHDPHGAPQKALLRKVPHQICVDCHKSIHAKTIEAIAEAKFPHRPVQKGDCSSCHGAHFTDFERLLKAPL